MEVKKIVTGILEENCYVVSQNGTCLIIDPGSDFAKIKELIGTDKILAVLVTHLHFDHIGALRDFLDENKKLKVYKKSNVLNVPLLQIGNFEIKPIYTPGHSSDSISYYFEQEKVLFTGDFMFRDTVGRCDLPTGDSELMNQSLQMIKNYPDDIIIYPGHGDNTTLGREKQYNFYLQEDMPS